MKPTCLALDLGSTMGWAVHCQGIYTAGSIKLQHKPKEQPGWRFFRFSQWLREALRVEKPDKVFYEQVRRHMSTDSAHAYGGYQAIMRSILDTAGVPVVGLAVGTIKKAATGNGAAKKPEMMAAAKKRWPDIEIIDDNTSDALYILELGLQTL